MKGHPKPNKRSKRSEWEITVYDPLPIESKEENWNLRLADAPQEMEADRGKPQAKQARAKAQS